MEVSSSTLLSRPLPSYSSLTKPRFRTRKLQAQKPRKLLVSSCHFLLHNCPQKDNNKWAPLRKDSSSTFSPKALGPVVQRSRSQCLVSFNNVSEDTDDMYDDLFKKYGEVVFRRNDQKSPSTEIDDDAESLSFAVEVAKVASDVKAGDIKVLFVKPLVYWTRFFIIATAFSRPQIDAIGSRIRDLAETQYGRVPSGDSKPNSWTLLDFGDVVVHIFLPPQRDFYNLEEFYANATAIELPFENQQTFRN